MIVYLYDEKGFYLYSYECQIDPLESELSGKDVYLIPPNSTKIEPPSVGENHKAFWDGAGWQDIDMTPVKEEYIPTEEDLKRERMVEISVRLSELTQDFIQESLGAVFDDIEERRKEFISLHNELRVLLGKEPREYK